MVAVYSIDPRDAVDVVDVAVVAVDAVARAELDKLRPDIRQVVLDWKVDIQE